VIYFGPSLFLKRNPSASFYRPIVFKRVITVMKIRITVESEEGKKQRQRERGNTHVAQQQAKYYES
jgi:hypothetical protein